jgi:uncharacterized protein
MSQAPVPSYVDTRKIFQHQWEISGFIDLARMPRFRESLASDAGSVNIDMRFTINEAKRQIMTGRLEASVEVSCQRCLEPLAIELTDDIRLALVKDEEAAKKLEAEWDPWIFTDTKLDLAELIEEQLMLCMPIVNMHAKGECQQRMNYGSEVLETSKSEQKSKENPFSVLKALKENKVID